MTMQYYTFHQINSGGYFEDHTLIVVKAPSADAANEFAEKYTSVYFDWDYEMDCQCCGMRWYPQHSDNEGSEVPMLYDQPLEDHTHWVGLQHVENGDKETWMIYDDYQDPTQWRAGMTVCARYNDDFFHLNHLLKAPEGSTIYGAVFDGGPDGHKKITIDIDDLVEQGIGYNESYHWDEVTVDILLKHKQENYRQEEKERKKNRR